MKNRNIYSLILILLIIVFNPFCSYAEEKKVNKERPENEIHFASAGGDLEKVNELIEKDRSLLNREGKHGLTPVHYAAQQGHLNIIKFLISKGADFKSYTTYGAMPVHEAARFGKLETVKYFISQGINVNEKDLKDETILYWAINYSGSLPLVKYLVEKDADINKLDPSDANILHFAAAKSKELTAYCLELGLDINKNSENAGTPLHVAVEYGSPDTVKYLVEHGADISFRRDRDYTPFHLIAFSDSLDYKKKNVSFFLSKGLNIEEKTQGGETILQLAARCHDEDFIDYLISKGANVEGRDNGGNTPLISAITILNSENVECLLKNGASVNIINNHGESPMDVAIEAGYAYTMPTINPATGKRGKQDPMFMKKATAIIKALIKRGAKINKVGTYRLLNRWGIREIKDLFR